MTTRSHSVNTRANFQRVDSVTWVGSSCGRHGSYLFYKAFRFYPSKPTPVTSSTTTVHMRSRARERRTTVNDNDLVKPTNDQNLDGLKQDTICDERILSLGEFFFVQCRPEDPVCVGELQLLWHDKHSGQDLSSTRLYYLPETTPAGRTSYHGQDEVLAVSEKVVMRTGDLASWVVEPEEWNYGCSISAYQSPIASYINHPLPNSKLRRSFHRLSVNMDDVKLEKQLLLINFFCPTHKSEAEKQIQDKIIKISRSCNHKSVLKDDDQIFKSNDCKDCQLPKQKAQIVVLSLHAYCRHKAVMRRIEGSNPEWLSRPEANQYLSLLGAYTTSHPKLRAVFCRETFDYSQLFEHDLICEEFAPVFKGRPRKKPKKGNHHHHHHHHSNGKSSIKKSNGIDAIKGGSSTAENTETYSDNRNEADDVARSNRRRSKRRPQHRVSDDEGFDPSLAHHQLNKRIKRGNHRSAISITNRTNSKLPGSVATSKSEPSSPTEGNLEETAEGGRRRSKRGLQPRLTDLTIALRNSLLENHKVKQPKRERPSSSGSSSVSSDSSRSSSPTEESTSNEIVKTPSPSNSVTSAASLPVQTENAQLSSDATSPIDFSDMTLTSFSNNQAVKKDLDLSSDTNMYLRGLSEGHLPENKSDFLQLLYQFMREQNTPIGRIPSLGFKKLDLWAFFKLSQEYGGYDMVTAKRLWKHVYDRMGGNPSCTSAATCTRKHFEKLLLPLEKYLRQALRNKDMEASKSKTDTTAATKNEKPGNLTTLNGRTFDGDNYFHNSSKMSKPIDEVFPRQTSEAAPVSAPTSIASTELTKIGPTKVPSPVLTSSIAASMMVPHNDYMESLINKVVHSQFSVKTEENATNCSVLQNTNKSIDLTDSGQKSPLSSSSHVASEPTYTISKPLKTQSIFTKTHCPRNKAPPPFIPKSTLKQEVLPKPPSSVDLRSTPGFVELPQDREEIIGSLKRSSVTSLSTSSPKRSRDSVIEVNSLVKSNRHFVVNDMVSMQKDVKASSLSRMEHPTYSSFATNGVNPSNKLKTESLVSQNPGNETRPRSMLSSSSNSSSFVKSRPSAYVENRDRRLPVDRLHDINQLQNVASHQSNSSQITNPIKQQHSSARRYGNIPEERKERTYYRPNGMLANHRERQQQAKSAASVHATKDKKLSSEQQPRTQVTSHDERIANVGRGASKENNTLREDLTRSSKLFNQPIVKQETHRNSFSSSFSVDRLTSDVKRSTALAGSSAPTSVHTDRPLASSSIGTHNNLSKFVDSRQPSYRAPTDSFRSFPFNPVRTESTRSEARFDRAVTSDAHDVAKRNLSSNVANSSEKQPSSSQTARGLPESIPPQLLAQLPRDCTAAELEHFLTKLPYLHNAGGFPQTMMGVPPINQVPIMHEALLRADPTLLRRHQEQQLLAELSRNPLLGNPMLANDLTLISMLNTYQALRQSQATNSTLPPHLSTHAAAAALAANHPLTRTIGSAAKFPAHSDLLNPAVRISAPLAMQQGSLLLANPQRPQGAADVRTPFPFPYARR